LATLGVVCLLATVLLAASDPRRAKTQLLTDLTNMRQILAASAMYQLENQEYLPHPTYGSVDGTASGGPDGWAYAVRNNGRLTNAPAFIPGCAGFGLDSVQYSNQVRFFTLGQLGPLLRGVKTLYCPTDVSQWNTLPFRNWFLGRYVKMTSYVMNASVGGYTGPRAGSIASGRTYKASDFNSQDILYWEQCETDGFFFNDAGNSPETSGERLTQRHFGAGPYRNFTDTSGGGGVVGRLNGAAEFMRAAQFDALANAGASRPNELLNGPGYQR
jgi:hypothetical protein